MQQTPSSSLSLIIKNEDPSTGQYVSLFGSLCGSVPIPDLELSEDSLPGFGAPPPIAATVSGMGIDYAELIQSLIGQPRLATGGIRMQVSDSSQLDNPLILRYCTSLGVQQYATIIPLGFVIPRNPNYKFLHIPMAYPLDQNHGITVFINPNTTVYMTFLDLTHIELEKMLQGEYPVVILPPTPTNQ